MKYKAEITDKIIELEKDFKDATQKLNKSWGDKAKKLLSQNDFNIKRENCMFTRDISRERIDNFKWALNNNQEVINKKSNEYLSVYEKKIEEFNKFKESKNKGFISDEDYVKGKEHFTWIIEMSKVKKKDLQWVFLFRMAVRRRSCYDLELLNLEQRLLLRQNHSHFSCFHQECKEESIYYDKTFPLILQSLDISFCYLTH